MRVATEEAAIGTHTLALGHMQATMLARQHPLGHLLRRLRALRLLLAPRAGFLGKTLHGATRPPDDDKYENEDQQIAHVGGAGG